MQAAIHTGVVPAPLPNCVPAARRAAEPAPPSRCKFSPMRPFRTKKKPAAGQPQNSDPSAAVQAAALGFGYALEYLPLSVPVRSEGQCTDLEPGASSPRPNRPPRKETKLRPNKLAPPTSGASPPDSCSLRSNLTVHSTATEKGGTCQPCPMGHVTSQVHPFRSLIIRRSGWGAWAKPAPSRLNGTGSAEAANTK